MRTIDESSFASRLDRLERQNHWLKIIVAVGCLLMGVPWLVQGATATQQTIEAQRYVLYDEWGNNRGGFEISTDGTAVLGMRDRFGRNRAVLTVGSHGKTQLGFIDAGGVLRVGLGSLTGGAPLLTLNDPRGKSLFKAP